VKLPLDECDRWRATDTWKILQLAGRRRHDGGLLDNVDELRAGWADGRRAKGLPC
jgi:hypothetical protein